MNTIKITALSPTCLENFKFRSFIKVDIDEDRDSELHIIQCGEISKNKFFQNMKVIMFFNNKLIIILYRINIFVEKILK